MTGEPADRRDGGLTMRRHAEAIRKALVDARVVSEWDPTKLTGNVDDAVAVLQELVHDLTSDHRYYAEDLTEGMKFWSPANRWETITDINYGREYSWHVRVWTDKTGPDYSWRFRNEMRLRAIDFEQTYEERLQPEVRVVDLPHSMSAVVTYRSAEIPAFMDLTLASANHRGKGQGWQVLDWPGGGDEMVTVEHPDKPAARKALMAIARAHGKALGLPVRRDNGRGW